MTIKQFVKKINTYCKNIIKIINYGGIVNILFTKVVNEQSLSGKVALITGGSSGFGFAIADQFLANGAKVIITGRNKAKLNEAITKLNSKNVKGIVWDISNTSIAKEKLAEAIAIFSQLDIAVNNAGVWSGESWSNVSENEWNKIMDVNAKGLFFICQAEGEYFKSVSTLNKIINITSMEGVVAGFGPYYASKWAANGLTKGIAKELIRFNVIVNAIAPGPAKTNLNREFFKGQEDNYYNPDSRSRTGRMVLVEEIAGLACFLASDSANSIIGQVIVSDGGISLN